MATLDSELNSLKLNSQNWPTEDQCDMFGLSPPKAAIVSKVPPPIFCSDSVECNDWLNFCSNCHREGAMYRCALKYVTATCYCKMVCDACTELCDGCGNRCTLYHLNELGTGGDLLCPVCMESIATRRLKSPNWCTVSKLDMRGVYALSLRQGIDPSWCHNNERWNEELVNQQVYLDRLSVICGIDPEFELRDADGLEKWAPIMPIDVYERLRTAQGTRFERL